MKTRAFLSLLVAAALTVAAVIAAPTAGAAGAQAAKPCQASHLVIWAGEEPGGGAAGSIYYRVEFTNLSNRTCTLAGYPNAVAVNLGGKRISSPARHEAGTKPRRVRLAPDQSAMAQLRIVDALNFPAGKCHATTAAGLRIWVPGGKGAKVAPLAFETCTRGGVQSLGIGAVKAD